MEAVQTEKQRLHKFDLIFRILAVAMAMSFITIGIVFYAIYHPTTPIVIKGTTITTPTVTSYGVVRYDFSYCKYTNKSPTVYRQIWPIDQSKDIVTFAAVLGVTQRGCHTAHLTLPMIPGTTPGVYTIHGHLVYQVNSFRTAEVDYVTDSFTVVE